MKIVRNFLQKSNISWSWPPRCLFCPRLLLRVTFLVSSVSLVVLTMLWSCPLPNQSKSHFVFTLDIALHSLLFARAALTLPTFLLVVLPAALCLLSGGWRAPVSELGFATHSTFGDKLRRSVKKVVQYCSGLIVLFSIDRLSAFKDHKKETVGLKGKSFEFISSICSLEVWIFFIVSSSPPPC